MTSKPSTLNTPGQKHGAFEVTRAIEIPELDCFLRELVHIPTKAKILHIANDDPENVFCLSFQTLPDSSNGVAHILEHTVLCGSKKYPIKDPFFAMQRRSLNTFMNAFTGADFTCYPAASQVEKDFYNLLDVYLDAVFHPNLNELSFLQEGHRLEFETSSDSTTPLEFKGIVFNEMKGALSSPGSRMSEIINNALFPDITYGVNSGGDPKDIPKLTYAQLKQFHETYYHPSRCLFYFYGDMPLEKHLDFIAEHTLENSNSLPPLPPIPLQPRFKQGTRLEKTYPVSKDEDDKTMITFAWLTCSIREQRELLALTILEIILLDTDASPLKKALLKSGLCKQVSAHMESDNNEVPMFITLLGCNPDSGDKLETLIFETLRSVVKEGISKDLFESAMHQLEFHRSEILGSQMPFGIHLFLRAGLLMQHGADPAEALMIHTLFEELREKTEKNPRYLSDLIQQYYLDNTHFVRVVLNPDTQLAAQELADEKIALGLLKQHLTPEQTEEIIAKTKQLEEFQQAQEEEDTDILPKVTLEDVPRKARDYPLHIEKVGNLTVYHHACFTNEIAYADLVFQLPAIPEEDLSLIRLLAIILPQMGCAGRSYSENLEFIQAHLGSIAASLTFNIQSDNHLHFKPAFNLRSKALHRKAEHMFRLMHEMTHAVDFSDLSRLREVITKHFSGLQTGLTQSAMKYATNLSASGLDVSSRLANDWYGLNYYHYVENLVGHIDQALADKLKHYADLLMGLEDPHLVLSCDASMYAEFKAKHFFGLADIATKSYQPFIPSYKVTSIENQGRTIATPVAFTSQVFKTVSYQHPDSPALLVAGHLFDNLTLHTAIREKGGAYGGGSSASNLAGTFSFYAYRDPNVSSTLRAFEESIQRVVEGDFDDEDLEEALLEIIQGFDSPVSPGSRADIAYGWLCENKPLEVRQAYRDRLLAMTKEKVIAAVKKHIVEQVKTGTVVVFADKDLLQRENKLLEEAGKRPLQILSV